MKSTFGRLETMLRGLDAQQRALDVGEQNIANANTPGYSRQAAVMATTPPYTVPSFNGSTQAGQIGTGVVVQSIQRLRDAFLDLQYRAQSAQLGTAQSQANGYDQLQAVFGEPSSTGVNATLGQFWQSWQDLANHPDDLATRAALVESANTLAASLNSARSQIVAQRANTAQQFGLQAGQINAIATQIAGLNAQIAGVLGAGQQPNDLLDTRDQLLDQLSQLVGTTNVTTPDGQVNVYIGGHALVDHNRAAAIQTATDASTGDVTLSWAGDGSPVAATAGSVYGLLQMANTVLPGTLGELTTLRDGIVDQVNAQHETGYGLNDPAGPPPGRDFFVVQADGSVAVNPAIAADPTLIAASSAAQTPGNADNALAIANLANAMGMSGGTTTIGGFYQALIARLGADDQQTGTAQTNAEAVVHNVDQRRQSVSGVSLDEEAANLVKYQHAYQAASRAMTVVDEMLDKLINDTGIAGR